MRVRHLFGFTCSVKMEKPPRAFREHSLQEKKNRSKLRKQRKRKKQRNAGSQTEQPSHSAAEVAERTPKVAKIGTPQLSHHSNPEKTESSQDRKLKAGQDKAQKHAVIFYNNWMKSERSNLPNIKMEDINLTAGDELGRGSYGVCRQGSYGGTRVVVKEILRCSESNLEEAMILRKLRHPNIQIFIGVAYKGNTVHLVTKFHGRKDGQESLTIAKAAEQKLLQPWACTFPPICDAIAYLHNGMSVIHNDIKENNIVMEETPSGSLIPIIIDFGRACFIHEAKVLPKPKVSCPFIAPELNAGERQSFESDIFSFGYTLRRVSHIAKEFSLRGIYRNCLSANPTERPDVKSLCEALQRKLNHE